MECIFYIYFLNKIEIKQWVTPNCAKNTHSTCKPFSYLFLQTKRAIRAATTISTTATTITPAIVPVDILVPVWASLPPSDGTADLPEPPGVVSGGVSVLSGKTTGVTWSDVVGFVVKGSVEETKVEPVVSSVNEFEVWLLMVVGWTVIGALTVLPCVDSGVVGAGARDFKRD